MISVSLLCVSASKNCLKLARQFAGVELLPILWQGAVEAVVESGEEEVGFRRRDAEKKTYDFCKFAQRLSVSASKKCFKSLHHPFQVPPADHACFVLVAVRALPVSLQADPSGVAIAR